MYLHYYLNERLVGKVDVTVVENIIKTNRKENIGCVGHDEYHQSLLSAQELIFGTDFCIRDTSFMSVRHFTHKPVQHVFLTRKVGSELTYSGGHLCV